MRKKLNPARILEIHESPVDLLHDIIKMCRSLSGKLNHHNLQSSQRNLILQKWYSKSFKTKRSQKSSQTCHFNSTFVINWYFTDFFCQWKSTKICRKAKHDILYIFHVYLDNSKRTITQGTSAPEDFLPRGNFWPRKFSPRRLLSKKDPLCQGDFLSKKMSTPLEPLFRDICVIKDTLMAKHVVWSRVLTKQKSDTFGDYSREKLTCKLKSSYGIFCS